MIFMRRRNAQQQDSRSTLKQRNSFSSLGTDIWDTRYLPGDSDWNVTQLLSNQIRAANKILGLFR